MNDVIRATLALPPRRGLVTSEDYYEKARTAMHEAAHLVGGIFCSQPTPHCVTARIHGKAGSRGGATVVNFNAYTDLASTLLPAAVEHRILGAFDFGSWDDFVAARLAIRGGDFSHACHRMGYTADELQALVIKEVASLAILRFGEIQELAVRMLNSRKQGLRGKAATVRSRAAPRGNHSVSPADFALELEGTWPEAHREAVRTALDHRERNMVWLQVERAEVHRNTGMDIGNPLEVANSIVFQEIHAAARLR